MKLFFSKKLLLKLFVAVVALGIFGRFLLVRFYSPPTSCPNPMEWSSLIMARHNDILPQSDSSNPTPKNSEQEAVPPQRRQLIVNTSTCKIPNISPWAESIKKAKCSEENMADPKCGERGGGHKWMYLQDSKLIFNDSALHGTNYTERSLSCCYHVIRRLEQSLFKDVDLAADDYTSESNGCHPIWLGMANDITAEFIHVICKAKNVTLFNGVVYEEYFALAQPDPPTQRKISKWKNLKTQDPGMEIPPSIVILGIEGNSRLNTHRQLPQTLKTLQRMDAVELLGYTKVGDNTLSNTIAFLAGMTADDMLQLCYSQRNASFDGCPFIWKDFDRAGYLTATAEDAPMSTSFNYHRNGFVVKPVDFYYRPFLVASSSGRYNIKCVGHHSTMELLLTYLGDILQRGSDGAPVFIHSWASLYSHECIHSLRLVDDTIAKFVEAVDKENTILVLMSDHGSRYGPFRQSAMGWYEDKLPSLWIYLPERVRKRRPQWHSNLKLNAERLTSHFDLYQTFVQILESYTVDPDFRVNAPLLTNGQSLLEPVPEERTCSQAEIPEGYCACSAPKPIPMTATDNATKILMWQVAQAGVSYLGKTLPRNCAKLSVKKVVSGKRIEAPDGRETLVVQFLTNPGDYLLEVTSSAGKIAGSKRQRESGRFSVAGFESIARLSSMNLHRDCVEEAVFERYCYCQLVVNPK